MDKYVNGSTAYNYGNAVPYQRPYTDRRPTIVEVPKKKVTENSRVAVRLISFYLVMLFVLASSMVYSKVLIMQAQTDVENLQEQVATLTEENNVKKIQIEQSIDLKKIEEIAISQYGMQRPDNNQIVYVKVVQDDYGEIIKR